MKKTVCLLICICVLLTGCADSREVSDELYAIVLGVDSYGSGVRVTAAIPEYGSKEDYKTDVVSVESESLSDGLEKLSMMKSRKISLMHLKAVVFSDELARSGIPEGVASVMHSFETNNAMGVMISEGDASKLIKNLCDNTSGDVSSEIEVMLLSKRYNPYCPVVLFEDFYNRMKSSYRAPFAMYVTENGTFRGIALFSGNKKTGILSRKESAYIMLALGEADGVYMDFDTGDGEVKLRLDSEKSKIRVEDSVNIAVDVKGKTDYSTGFSVNNEEIRNQIQNGIKSVVVKSNICGCDILGLNGFNAVNFGSIQSWKKSKPDFDNISVSVRLALSQSVNG